MHNPKYSENGIRDVTAGRRDYTEIEKEARQALEESGLRPDYFSIRHARTLEVAGTGDTELVLLGAVYLGKTRLIDNVTVQI